MVVPGGTGVWASWVVAICSLVGNGYQALQPRPEVCCESPALVTVAGDLRLRLKVEVCVLVTVVIGALALCLSSRVRSKQFKAASAQTSVRVAHASSGTTARKASRVKAVEEPTEVSADARELTEAELAVYVPRRT